MIQTIAENSKYPFEWLDVKDPDEQELGDLAKKYQLHNSSVYDWQQKDHLPKYEQVGDYAFIIFRLHTEEVGEEADTVQELTDKVAIFVREDQIITLHKTEWAGAENIKENAMQQGNCETTHQLVNEIVKSCLSTYEVPSQELTRQIEFYEENMFLKQRKPALLKGLYYLRRRVDVTRRIIMLTYEIIDRIDSSEKTTAYTRDTRDLYVKLHNIYDTLFENVNHLMNIYFSISSQRTNEIVRVLTIFSVFFMPLTFIVGIYGMNFRYMPELNMKLGYPGVMIAMALITASIYIVFKRKGWL